MLAWVWLCRRYCIQQCVRNRWAPMRTRSEHVRTLTRTRSKPAVPRGIRICIQSEAKSILTESSRGAWPWPSPLQGPKCWRGCKTTLIRSGQTAPRFTVRYDKGFGMTGMIWDDKLDDIWLWNALDGGENCASPTRAQTCYHVCITKTIYINLSSHSRPNILDVFGLLIIVTVLARCACKVSRSRFPVLPNPHATS